MKTWWVEYSWDYELKTADCWEHIDDFDAERFRCKKRDIMRELRKKVKSSLSEDEYCFHKGLHITITDFYETTEYEV